jgi:ATP-dependent Clp protease ATP-binding subunit ClpC
VPKVNVYLPEALAEAVRDAQLPVSAICQTALEKAVRDVASMRGTEQPPPAVQPGVGGFARFTPRARRAVELSEQGARAIPHDFVGTEHLLLGVIDEGNNLALKVLAALEIEPSDLRAEVVASMPGATTRVGGRIPFTPLAKRALELTVTEAQCLAHNYVGCEHLLLGLLSTEDGLASHVLQRMGLELRTTRRAVITALVGLVHARKHEPTATASDAALEEILRRLEAIERRLGGAD